MSAPARPLNGAPHRRALLAGRVAAIVTAIGAASSPPVAVAGSIAMVCALALVGDARLRLGEALRSPLGRGVMALFAALCLAAVTGLTLHGQPRLVLNGLMDWRHLLVLVPVALALYGPREADGPRWVRRFALSWVAFAAVAATAGLAALALGYGYGDRPPGVLLRNHVTQSMVMGAGILMAGVLLATGLAGSRRTAAALLAAIALAGGAMLLIHPGRSGLIALAVAGVVAVWQLAPRGKRWRGPAAAGALATVVLFAVPGVQQRFQTGLDELRSVGASQEITSMGIRVVIWETTGALIAQRPLLGHGLGGFDDAYRSEIGRRHAGGWRATPVADPHNQYLFLWVQAGLPGLAAFVLLLVGAARQPAATPWRTIGQALLAAWCVTSLFSSHFQTFSEGHLIAVMVGVFLAARDQPVRSTASTAAMTS